MVIGRQLCERVGKREKRPDERVMGCQMCRVEKIVRGMTGIEKVLLQVEERQREEMPWWEMKGRSGQAK